MLRAREHLRDCATLGSGAEREACQHLSSQLRLQAFNIDYLLKCTFFTHLPMVLKMRAYQTWAFTGLVLASNVCALLVPGPVHWGLLANLVVQFAFLIPENVLLRMDEARAKQQFAYIMAIRLASAVQRDLLHTLIPPKVLSDVTNADEAGQAAAGVLAAATHARTCNMSMSISTSIYLSIRPSVYLSMYIYIYICMYIYLCIHLYVSIYIHTHIYLYMCVYIYTDVYICIYIYGYTY